MRRVKPLDSLEDETYTDIVSKDFVTCDVVYYDVYDGVRRAALALRGANYNYSTSFEDEDETS